MSLLSPRQDPPRSTHTDTLRTASLGLQSLKKACHFQQLVHSRAGSELLARDLMVHVHSSGLSYSLLPAALG